MATSIHSSLSCLLPFYTIPIFPLFKLKDFSFTCNTNMNNIVCMYHTSLPCLQDPLGETVQIAPQEINLYLRTG